MVEDAGNVLEEIENMEFEDYFPLEKIRKYACAKQIYERQGNNAKVKEINWEVQLLIREAWNWCLSNPNMSFPEWDQNAAEYYERRLEETNVLLNKARYAYALWTLKRDLDYAILAIKLFASVGELYIKKGWYKKDTGFEVASFCFEMASRTSLRLQPQLFSKIIEQIVSCIKVLDKEDEMGRGMIDLVRLVADLAQDIKRIPEVRKNAELNDAISFVFDVSNNIAQKRADSGEYHWQRSYLEASVKLASFLGEDEKARKIKAQIASSFEEEGYSRESKIVQIYFYRQALSLYSEIGGHSGKLKDLKLKIAKCLHEAEEKGEFKEISVKVEIPVPKIVEEYTNKIRHKSPQEILKVIVCDDQLIPKKSMVRNFVEETKKKYPLSFLIPTQLFARFGPIKKFETENEIFEYKLKEQFNIEAVVGEIVINRLFENLIKIGKIQPADILTFLGHSKNITKNCYQMVKEGIDSHFSGNYVASIHILIPQIEEILRSILRNHDIPPVNYDSQGRVIEEKLLGALITESEIFLGEDFAEYLKVRLWNDFANVRNDVCHGWMQFHEFTETLSTTLIYIILRLCLTN